MTAVAEPVLHLTGIPVAGLAPGSPEWLLTMSASKVAAALGLSPYDSPFSLWHRMSGQIPTQPSEPHLQRGHYLEAGVAAWFADQHPDWTVNPGRSWAHPEQPLYTAAPDRLLILPSGELRGLELKTAADDREWGTPGTDEIPAGYRAQVIWQMFCTGTRITHIAVLSAYLELLEYEVHYDQDEAEFIRDRAQAFLDTLPTGAATQRPSIDTHGATYDAVKQLHPEIDGTDVELEHDLVIQYCQARHALKHAEEQETYAKSLVSDELGDAKRARYLGKTIAQRQAKAEGTPYLVAGRNLPTFTQEADPS